METGEYFKTGEPNWVGNPIVFDMALELFARTHRAYNGTIKTYG